jgi:hypothetical protein
MKKTLSLITAGILFVTLWGCSSGGGNTMEHDFDSDRDGITKGIVGGIGVFLGAATTFIHNEIDDCDIGIMLGAQGSVVRGNYIHDLIMGIDDAPGVDSNLVGGA